MLEASLGIVMLLICGLWLAAVLCLFGIDVARDAWPEIVPAMLGGFITLVGLTMVVFILSYAWGEAG